MRVLGPPQSGSDWLPDPLTFSHLTGQDKTTRLGGEAMRLLAIGVALSFPLLAQIGGSGSIQGVVSDPSGAVIPGATVVANNVATGVKTTRSSTAAGLYLLSPLVAGEYTVTVSAGGFQSLLQEHVVVDALGVVGLNFAM